MFRRSVLTLATFLALLQFQPGTLAQAPAPARPVPDISGKWTASFETQIGVQEYTYDFVAKDKVLTGTMSSSLGSKSDVRDGRIDGTAVTFKETLTFMEMAIDISYTGQIVSADEIKFSRAVGEFATEELVAKRAK
jgi:hypothetical protein